MLAQCFDQMRRGACATCDHRQDCRFAWWEDLAAGLASRRRAPEPGVRSGRSPRNPLRALLGEVAKVLESRPRTKPRSRPTPFRDEIERHLESRLESGDFGIDLIARGLGVSRQTLYRRLKAEGATFAGLLDDLRRRLALRCIREQGLSVKETAYRLGFSDPAAFSRAFKRWTGASPTAAAR